MKPFSRLFIAWLTSLAILVAASPGALPGGTAGAQSAAAADKISPDLRRKSGQSPGERVGVIVEPAGVWDAALNSAVKGFGGTVTRSYKNFAGRAVSLPAAAAEALAGRPDVAFVSADRELVAFGHVTLTTGADAARKPAGSAVTYNGAGVGIAVIDSGVYANHDSFSGRVVYSQDFTGENRTDDPYGHGTHVASVAASNGAVAQGAYSGLAGGARLVNLRVLDSRGRGTTSGLLAALDWVLTNRTNPAYNVRVVNLSLGMAAVDSYRNDPLCRSVRRLADAGVIVVAAAGNEGKDDAGRKIYGQVHSPGNDPSVITVGASNSFGTDTRADDEVTTYSSRGPTRGFRTDAFGVRHYDNLVKPDLVAPGNKIIAAQSPGNYLISQNAALDANVSGADGKEQMYLSGTSMATPVVAGAAAMMLQANPNLTPNLVKAILQYTAQPLARFNQFEQGAGAVNVEGAMRLARAVRADLSASTPLRAPLLTTAPPTPETTLAGHTFRWAQGVIMDHTFATGSNLVTKYQKVYSLGTLMGDGTVEAGGVLVPDGTVMSDAVIMSDNILTSTGIVIAEGSVFLGTGMLLGDGTVMTDAVLMGDGTLMGDGAVMADGVIVSDVSASALKVLLYGDDTPFMSAVIESSSSVAPSRPSAPGVLAATALSTSQIKLTWADNSPNEGGFLVERSTDGVNFTQVALLPPNTTSYTNAGLAAGKTFYYRMCAYSSGGNSPYTATAAATTKRR
ncbi:MAG TPA: S8 family serine peptidase [Pyrinomonadaceae bacterium]|nr:S8 family serine peptidase [Pyrinomonadaceae bacterium]